MRLDHAEDLAKFAAELKKETDRGLPLVGTVLIDEKLREILEAYFISSKVSNKILNEVNSPLGTFSARLDACYVLGLIDDFEHSEINILRKIRNEFAHSKHGLTFQTGKIKDICANLKTIIFEIDGYSPSDPKFIFMCSVVNMALRLYLRPDLIKKKKRVTKSWGENNGVLITHTEENN